MPDYKIITVDNTNVDEHGFFCVTNKNHPGYKSKRSWLDKRFGEGLKIRMIVTAGGKKAGFVEYTPGEYTWRVINAPGYNVIHCLWVASGKFPFSGMASALLDECFNDALVCNKAGLAVVTSDGSWMAGSEIYLKNGFESAGTARPGFHLLVRKSADEPMPTFPSDWQERLDRIGGLQLLYTPQCPYIGKALEELPPVAEHYGARLKLVEIDSSAEARKIMPSPYGVMSLVHDGRLLADHAISATRFRNILEKDLRLKAVH